MYQLIKQENTIAACEAFYFAYPQASNRNEALADMYELVKAENTIACYAWFLVNFTDAPQAGDALLRMYAEAFKGAKQINTVEALNDFIIAYPLAREVHDARDIAYQLEKERYMPANAGEKEDQARTLLTRLLRMRLNGKDIEPPDRQLGYALIVQRMTDLLETEFPAQKATSEVLFSEEAERFRKELKQSLGSIQESLYRLEDAIHQNTHQTAALIRQQTSVMSHHFGIMENVLQGISFNTQSIAHSAQATAWNSQAIAQNSQTSAESAQMTAWNTQSIAGQMPRLVDAANRQAQSQEYLNWHVGQFTDWVQRKRYEDEQRRIGY